MCPGFPNGAVQGSEGAGKRGSREAGKQGGRRDKIRADLSNVLNQKRRLQNDNPDPIVTYSS
jgi:hypothetical protein